jgi:hypothetical protein
MADIGPTADGIVIAAWVAQYKALNDIAASPIGASCQGARSEGSAAVSQETAVTDVGPMCGNYDPELASALGVDLA